MNPPAHFGTVCRLDSPAGGAGHPCHTRGSGFGLALVRIKTAIGSRCAPDRGAARAGCHNRSKTVDEVNRNSVHETERTQTLKGQT